ncbi:hypothetical protein OU798_21810 [Prolixibacteraceae bacterium Z1-6]|uniref:Lipoprotein n=1 Tax=Draconibacterium aestuarii TaxID=2998507 RepID=A0A9X3J6T5_9BACT|nr:hypothetical protein [Prolixibacteraceae bacterium Z1-6]
MKKVVILLLLLFIFSCSEDKNGIELAIAETGCMNAWDDYYSENNDYRDAVEKYLESNGISVYRVYAERYSNGPFCLACTCPTGRLIFIRIHEEDQIKAEQLGFTLYNDGNLIVPDNE